MFINFFDRTIELTKKEMKAAGHFGSDEYNELMTARKDNPGYRVVVSTRKAKAVKKDTYKGLTYEYMEAYIEAHDQDQSIMKEYRKLRGLCENIAENAPDPYTYQEMKEWFLDKFQEVANLYAGKHAA